MPQRKGKPVSVKPQEERKTEAAFDVWLQRGLHKLFDEVAKEPIPDELLELINADRKTDRKT